MVTTKPISILGISGSSRIGSLNKSLLNSARELLPANARLELAEIANIPLYNQDDELSLPLSVELLKERVSQADAILLATPEYNHSIPPVLKNALDWASRPAGMNSWSGKPVAIIGASAGAMVTSRGQLHLRQVLAALEMQVVNTPEVFVGCALQRFDVNGCLIGIGARDLLQRLLEHLTRAAEKHRQ